MVLTALSNEIVAEFCSLCNLAYQSWRLHKLLIDDNPHYDAMRRGKCGSFLERLSKITQEYALLQLVKLHDPAVQKNSINLTLEYVITYGGWDEETSSQLKELHTKLDSLAKKIRTARHKFLSHNDLDSILSNAVLGEFEKGADNEYYKALQKFVNIVHINTPAYGRPYPFEDDAVDKDVQSILDHIPYEDKT